MECLASVIIPAYNSEKYIKRCIESILMYGRFDLEVIVINDGSCDQTETIVKQLAEQDNRVKLYSQTNQGVSSARNAGLNISQGKYILFSDSDDALDGSKLENMLLLAEEKDADLIVFGRINHYPDGTIVKLLPKEENIDVKKNYDYALQRTLLNQRNFGWSSCNKLFKRELIIENDIRFIDYTTINSEDRLFNIAYFSHVSRVVFYEQCAFHNYVRTESLSRMSVFQNAADRNINTLNYVCKYMMNFPVSHQQRLLKYYFLSFLNNAAVLELQVNNLNWNAASRSYYRTIEGMITVIKNNGMEKLIENEKGILLPERGMKYHVLNYLIFKKKMFGVTKILLFCYIKLIGKR